ncbi:DUF6415 family natural product biosynthesis protein [Streptomyces sp. NPDC001817]|uniref:DUF6415 family natural product biosynthesis protein n=1 Tax=Streptomyces sp. NPDC001817 TaxID=3154398 RepID=UPI003331C51B
MSTTLHQDNDSLVADIKTMRETAALLLGPDDGPDALPPAVAELDTLTAMLRGHLALLIPEVEAKAWQLPKDSVRRYRAVACVDEANSQLRVGDGCTPAVRVAVARKLARSLNALCRHFDLLDGQAPMGEQS